MIIWFTFFFKLPDGREEETEIAGSDFEECLAIARQRAAYAKAEIIAWVEQ